MAPRLGPGDKRRPGRMLTQDFLRPTRGNGLGSHVGVVQCIERAAHGEDRVGLVLVAAQAAVVVELWRPPLVQRLARGQRICSGETGSITVCGSGPASVTPRSRITCRCSTQSLPCPSWSKVPSMRKAGWTALLGS